MYWLNILVIVMFKSFLKIFVIGVLIIFIASYMVGESGYYEYSIKRKTVITNEKIKEFEQDIKNNKDIDLIDYLDKDDVNYSNKVSGLMYSISDSSNKLARKIIKKIFQKIGSWVEE